MTATLDIIYIILSCRLLVGLTKNTKYNDTSAIIAIIAANTIATTLLYFGATKAPI